MGEGGDAGDVTGAIGKAIARAGVVVGAVALFAIIGHVVAESMVAYVVVAGTMARTVG